MSELVTTRIRDVGIQLNLVTSENLDALVARAEGATMATRSSWTWCWKKRPGSGGSADSDPPSSGVEQVESGCGGSGTPARGDRRTATRRAPSRAAPRPPVRLPTQRTPTRDQTPQRSRRPRRR